MYCKWCGTENESTNKYCISCGKKLQVKKESHGLIKIFIPIVLVLFIFVLLIGYKIYLGGNIKFIDAKGGKVRAIGFGDSVDVEFGDDKAENSKSEDDCISQIEKLGKKYGWEEIGTPENKEIIKNQLSGSWYDSKSVHYELEEEYFTEVKFDIIKMYKNDAGYFFVISHTYENPQDLYGYQTFNNGNGICMQDVKSYYADDKKISSYLTKIYDNPLLLGYQMVPQDEGSYNDSGNQKYTDEDGSDVIETYFPGNVGGDILSAYVYYARVIYDESIGANVVAVGCSVFNRSNNNIPFVASNYFELNDHGIITNALPSDYDNTTIAVDGNFFTEIKFMTNTAKKHSDTFAMTMTVDGSPIHLGAYPQKDEESHAFPGVYMQPETSYEDIFIITDNLDGTYNVIKVDSILNNVIQVKDISLDANNKFGIQNGEYLWDSDNSCFYRYDERKGEYDKSQPYTKQYYTGE